MRYAKNVFSLTNRSTIVDVQVFKLLIILGYQSKLDGFATSVCSSGNIEWFSLVGYAGLVYHRQRLPSLASIAAVFEGKARSVSLNNFSLNESDFMDVGECYVKTANATADYVNDFVFMCSIPCKWKWYWLVLSKHNF